MNYLDIFKITIPYIIPSGLNILTHYVCDYMGCNNWYTLFGYNLACNTCIDFKKTLKDHQLSLVMYLGGKNFLN